VLLDRLCRSFAARPGLLSGSPDQSSFAWSRLATTEAEAPSVPIEYNDSEGRSDRAVHGAP
jgi:hypothetical protein